MLYISRLFWLYFGIVAIMISNDVVFAYDFKNTAIPSFVARGNTNNYHCVAIDYKNRKFNEKIVEVKDVDVIPFYNLNNGLNYPYNRRLKGSSNKIFLRETVAKKLKQVNNFLKPYKVQIVVLDGYRKLELQKQLWDFFVEAIKLENPSFSQQQINNVACNYCSNPVNFSIHDSTSWFTHSTGGSVDLTLKDTKINQLLFMGSIFDDPSNISTTNYFEVHPLKTLSEKLACQNRRILYNAMIKAGFTNYSFEWWHYDYGNQMWLMNLDQNKKVKGAFYGAYMH